jgi:hypothetical protein
MQIHAFPGLRIDSQHGFGPNMHAAIAGQKTLERSRIQRHDLANCKEGEVKSNFIAGVLIWNGHEPRGERFIVPERERAEIDKNSE